MYTNISIYGYYGTVYSSTTVLYSIVYIGAHTHKIKSLKVDIDYIMMRIKVMKVMLAQPRRQQTRWALESWFFFP